MSRASLPTTSGPDDAFEDSLSCPLFEFFEADNARPCDEDWEGEEERACQGQLRRTLVQLLRPSSIFQAKVLRDVRQFKAQLLAEDEAESFLVVCLAARLSNVGYRLQIRNALGGGYGPDCFRQLRHEFLVVAGEGDMVGADLIVEPAFSTHFQIGGQGSPRYQQLLDMLPAELVAPQATLAALTQLLCAEMRTAFKLTGLTMPPWRQGAAMLSKWLPQKAHDWPPLKSFKSGPSSSSPDGASPSPRGVFSLSSSTTTGASPASPDPSLLKRSPVILGFSPAAQVPAAAADALPPDLQPQHWPSPVGPAVQVHGVEAAGGEQAEVARLGGEAGGWQQHEQQEQRQQEQQQWLQQLQVHHPTGNPAKQLHRLSVCSSAQSPQPPSPASLTPQSCSKPRRPSGPPGGLSALLSGRRPAGLTGFAGGLAYKVAGPESPPLRTVKLKGPPVQE